MIQQFIHTIAKEEIAKLTVEEFKGRIITILSKEEADKAVEYLLRFPIVGFDTETRPSFKKGQRYKISLMQISTDDTCFLFRLNHIGIPESLEKFLKSSSTLKIGLSLRDDFGAIRKRSDIEPANFLDLQNYVDICDTFPKKDIKRTTPHELGGGCIDRLTKEICGPRCLGLPKNI